MAVSDFLHYVDEDVIDLSLAMDGTMASVDEVVARALSRRGLTPESPRLRTLGLVDTVRCISP